MTLITTNNELIKEHMKESTEEAVSNAAEAVLRAAGLRRVGQRVRILRGRHRGLTGSVVVIRWSEAEIQIQGCPCWFSLWHDRHYFEVLEDGSSSPVVELSWMPKSK